MQDHLLPLLLLLVWELLLNIYCRLCEMIKIIYLIIVPILPPLVGCITLQINEDRISFLSTRSKIEECVRWMSVDGSTMQPPTILCVYTMLSISISPFVSDVSSINFKFPKWRIPASKDTIFKMNIHDTICTIPYLSYCL